jgi:hypothetical protein
VSMLRSISKERKGRDRKRATHTWINFSACVAFHGLIGRYVGNISTNRAKVRCHDSELKLGEVVSNSEVACSGL